MDLLASIINSMDKPPSLSERDRQLLKKKKQEIEKKQTEAKEHLKKFKERVEAKLLIHFRDPQNTMLKFEPMDQVHRSIVHEAAESQNLLSYAFGNDGIDRYIRVYNKNNAPCEDEITARRRGEPWNETIKHQLLRNRELQKIEALESAKIKKKKMIPNSNYKDKYAHLIGQDAALEAAKKTVTNESYGFVPSQNKKDHRSIEQTLADIKAKRRKLNEGHTNVI